MTTKTITRVTAALGLVEAAHDGNGDWQAWCETLLAGAKPLLTSSMVNLGLARRREHHFEFVAGASDNLPQLYEYYRSQTPRIPATDADPLWRFPRLVSTMNAILGPDPSSYHVQQFMKMSGAPDVLGLVAVVDDLSLMIGAPHGERIALGVSERRLLSQVTLHVEAGLRLRAHPGTEIAILDPSGRLLHAEGIMRNAAQLRFGRHVTNVERGRTRKMRQSPAALDAWSALVSGNWGLVERVDSDGRRFYAVLATQRSSRILALTQLEAGVLELSARGLSGKAVAYALGVGATVVSRSLSIGCVKLGARNRTELVGLVAQLLGTSRIHKDTERLTSAERDVLKLVRLGWQNATIAQTRGRSERTVANQVSALLRKLDAPSRRALATSNVPGLE